MADAKLHASRDFFKEISTEAQQLQLIAQYLQIFVDRARERGFRGGDNHLLLILDQLESLFAAIRECSDRLEKIATRVSVCLP